MRKRLRRFEGDPMTTQSFDTHSSVWDENAKRDARWAVISDPAMVGKEWNDEGFFNSGRVDVDHFLSLAESAGAMINKAGEALDFGSGLGRLSQGLAAHFSKVTGIDVSPEMVRQAKELNKLPNIEFLANTKPDLSLIQASSKDLVLSLIVIQHIPPPYSLQYLKDFARVLKKDGTLIVQIPSRRFRSPKNTLRKIIPEKIFRLKHKLTKSDQPYVTMFGIEKSKVVTLFREQGLSVLKANPDTLGGEDWESFTYIAKKL